MKVFKEEQVFRQVWLIALMVISVVVSLALASVAYFKENSGMSLGEFILIIVSLIVCVFPVFFFKLKTRIDEKGIDYQFFPFHFSVKTIIWADIKTAVVRKYSAVSEYGGWGLKGGLLWNKKRGKAINVSGNIGIQLEFKNGKKLLLGTQKEQEAKQVLITYKNKIF